MKRIFDKYLNNYSEGLLLFDAPTGVGKTHASIEFMIDFLKNNKSNKNKIIYITNLKNNLPYEKLKELLNDDDLYRKECIVLKPYFEMLLDSYEVLENAPGSIKKHKEYKDLMSQINIVNHFESCLSDDVDEITKSSYKKQLEYLQTISEPKFREFLHTNFYVDKIVDNTIKEWIEKIYTSINFEKKKIIFMSTNRFVSPVDSFDNGISFLPTKTDLIKNSIIIIDEFDSSKDVLLNYIINSGIKNKINMIELISAIHSNLNDIDKDNLNYMITEGNNEYKEKVQDTIEKNISEINKFFDSFNINYIFKQKGLEKKKTFIFNEENKIYTNNKEYLVLKTEKDKKINIITKKRDLNKNTNLEDVKNLSLFINEIVTRINYFANGCSYLARDLLKIYNDNLTNDKDRRITYDEAVKSILSYFRFSKSHTDFLYDKIIHSKNTNYNENLPKGRQFFERGLSQSIIEDSHKHIFDSYIQYYEYFTTPEQIIYNLAKNTLVVGLSATASIDTTIGNYNLDFLKNKLKEKFYLLENEDIKIIKNRLKDKERNFLNGKSEIVFHTLDFTNNENKVDGEEVYFDLFEKVYNFEFNKKKDPYYLSIVKEILYCYSYMKENNIKSMILFLNSLELNGFKEENFKKIVNNDINIYYLKSEDFNLKFKEIKNKLLRGEKVLVYTTYNTIGTGKNIQYEIPDRQADMFCANLENCIERDFEAIFLCKPTNLLERMNIDESTPFDLVLKSISMALFQTEYLYKNGNLSYDVKEKHINQIFRKLNNLSFGFFAPKTIDFVYHVAKIIIQAIGRICRTSDKSKKVHIIAEESIVKDLLLIKDELNKRILNKEFYCLINNSIVKENSVYKKNEDKNKECDRYLFGFYREHIWTEFEKQEWNKIREHVLKYPTDNCIRNDNEFLIDFYWEFNKDYSGYYINYDDKYKKIFSLKPFEKNDNNSNYSNNYVVSSIASNLSSLMKYKPLRDYFNKKRYATYFKKNKYIMCECLFKSVYLGALGEVCGKYLLEGYFDGKIKLEEMPLNLYERFDYRYKDYYFDFKNWYKFRADRSEMLKKITDKLAEVNGKKAFIINIISDEGYTLNQHDDETIIEIPSLLVKRGNGDVEPNEECLNYIRRIIEEGL